MSLLFDQALVRQLLAHSQGALSRRPTFGQAEPAPPGLWLVGDEGVYAMSNGLPCLSHDDGGATRNLVCCANEANPHTLGRDRSDDAERASFGGDDEVDLLAAADLLRMLEIYPDGEPLALDVTTQTIAILPLAGTKTACRL